MFLVFLDHFDVLISKIIFKKLKKYYFNTFLNEKHFKKQPRSQSKTTRNHSWPALNYIFSSMCYRREKELTNWGTQTKAREKKIKIFYWSKQDSNYLRWKKKSYDQSKLFVIINAQKKILELPLWFKLI